MKEGELFFQLSNAGSNTSIVLIVSALLLVFYKWAIKKNNYFAELSVPYLQPKFFIGNMFDVYFCRSSGAELLNNLSKSFPNEK